MSASIVIASWYGSLQLSHVTEPLWFAAWGAGLIGAAMVIRRHQRPMPGRA